ncbi:hypothetical protein RN001_006019 [Aquatica leii]|uniref:Uncharacterized protein n=1 Tax=Aquatica leii TaxID=1421715 RepID=A0AAN7P7B2_9COLE|nr:hypothetical protein RN001_006019 [Aquatica leii]
MCIQELKSIRMEMNRNNQEIFKELKADRKDNKENFIKIQEELQKINRKFEENKQDFIEFERKIDRRLTKNEMDFEKKIETNFSYHKNKMEIEYNEFKDDVVNTQKQMETLNLEKFNKLDHDIHFIDQKYNKEVKHCYNAIEMFRGSVDDRVDEQEEEINRVQSEFKKLEDRIKDVSSDGYCNFQYNTQGICEGLKFYGDDKNYSNVWNNRNSDSAWNREEQRNSPYNNDFRRGNFVRYGNWNRDHYDNHRKEREDDRNRGQRNPETNYRNYERDNKEKEDRGNNYRTFDKVFEGKTYRNNNVIRGRGGTQAQGRGGYTGYVHNVNVIEQQNAINVVEEDSDEEASNEKSGPSQDTKPRGMYVSQQDFQ